MRLTLLMSIIFIMTTSTSASPPAGLDAGIAAMRDGRFEEARIRFERITRQDAASPRGPFFEGFLLWWRLLNEPADEHELRRRMEERLAEAQRRAEALESSPEVAARTEGAAFRGIALLLEAESRAARGAHLAGASSARRGHRSLTRTLEQKPGLADPLFALGAYDYYADKLPLIVKGIRFLLFIPAGNDRRGIERLEQAAARSDLFGTEALMLLAHIFSEEADEDLERALGYSRSALDRHPESPLIELAHTDLLFEHGRFRESSRHARAVLARLQGSGLHPPELAAFAAYRDAACILELHDPLGALSRIEAALARFPPGADASRRRWSRLLLAAARESGTPERAAAALPLLRLSGEDRAEAIRKLERIDADPIAAERAEALATSARGGRLEALRAVEVLAGRFPQDVRLRYDLGRLLQEEGRMTEARPHLEAAAEVDSGLAGWAMLRLGWDRERAGRRGEALPFYRRASEMKRFDFRPAARELLRRPADGQPEG